MAQVIGRNPREKVGPIEDGTIPTDRPEHSKAGSPGREPAYAKQVAHTKAKAAPDGPGLPAGRRNDPDKPIRTQRGPPQTGRANAEQAEHTKARARLARRIGPKEEGIDLVVMPDE